jgi:hypothetical protein
VWTPLNVQHRPFVTRHHRGIYWDPAHL